LQVGLDEPSTQLDGSLKSSHRVFRRVSGRSSMRNHPGLSHTGSIVAEMIPPSAPGLPPKFAADVELANLAAADRIARRARKKTCTRSPPCCPGRSAIPFLNERFARRTWNFVRWNPVFARALLSRLRYKLPHIIDYKTHRIFLRRALPQPFWSADCHLFNVPLGPRGCLYQQGQRASAAK
jgi:hypothetical protein